MADPYQPVKTGQSIDISARSFNGALKAGQDYSRRKLDDGNSQRDGRGIDPVNPPQAFNGLAAAIDEFSVLGFGVVPTIDTAGVPFEASSSPVFTAALPDAAAPFCITREPIPVGSLGQVVTNGAAVVKVNITDATHTRAVPITGDKTQLTSAASGGVPIIDRETGIGVKWAKVLMGGQSLSGTGFGGLVPTGGFGPSGSFRAGGVICQVDSSSLTMTGAGGVYSTYNIGGATLFTFSGCGVVQAVGASDYNGAYGIATWPGNLADGIPTSGVPVVGGATCSGLSATNPLHVSPMASLNIPQAGRPCCVSLGTLNSGTISSNGLQVWWR